MLAGSLVLVSFMLLYQDRLSALIKVFALHAATLSAAVAWQAHVRAAPHLYVTALAALVLKGVVIPLALNRLVMRLGVHREVESIVRIGPTMMAGIGLVALSMVVMLKAAPAVDLLAREDLAFALSIVLLGLMMMIVRRSAVSQAIGFLSMEDGLVLAATGAHGMPLVIEISVAVSVLVAFVVISVFLLRIRERFDTIDVAAIDRARGGSRP
jgi:hydrogenase-4 component E